MVKKQCPVLELANQMPVRNMDLGRAPRRTAREKGSGYENELQRIVRIECLSNSAEPTPASKLYISKFYGHKAGFPLAIFFARSEFIPLSLGNLFHMGFFYSRPKYNI